MNKYILVWQLTDVGNIYIERLGTEIELHTKVNELADSLGKSNSFSIIFAGLILHEYKYNPVEFATMYEPKIIVL